MRLRFDWRFTAGSLAALAALALSSPGVRVVRADEELSQAPLRPIAEGPSCQRQSQPGRVEVTLDLDPASETGATTESLNNRGYGYRTAAVDPEPSER